MHLEKKTHDKMECISNKNAYKTSAKKILKNHGIIIENKIKSTLQGILYACLLTVMMFIYVNVYTILYL